MDDAQPEASTPEEKNRSPAESSCTPGLSATPEEQVIKTSTWTKRRLIFAYLGIFLLAFATSLEGQTTINLQALATSSFETHSLMATISVVQGVIYSVVKSPIAKAADVLGHFAAFNASMFFLVLGYIQQACSHNIQTFASAQAFYATGMTGLQILQQIFIADTSSLLNRALFLSLPFTPFLVNVWLGPVLAGFFSNTDGSGPWRWGHAIWAIILPVMFVPLAVSLFLNEKKAKKYDIGIRFRQRTTILQTMKD